MSKRRKRGREGKRERRGRGKVKWESEGKEGKT